MANAHDGFLASLWISFFFGLGSIASLGIILYKLIVLQYRGFLSNNVQRTSTKFFVRMSIITISDLIVSFLCLFYIPFQIITSLLNGPNSIHNNSNCKVLLTIQYSLFFLSRLLYHFGNISRLRLMTENGKFQMSSHYYTFNLMCLVITMVCLPIILLYYAAINNDTKSFEYAKNNIHLCQYVGFIYDETPFITTLMSFYAIVDLLFIASIHFIVSLTFYKV